MYAPTGLFNPVVETKQHRKNKAMHLITELLSYPHVIAAGEYTYRGDRFSYRGHLTESQARLLSIVGRATTMSTYMMADGVAVFTPPMKLHPVRGWVLKGPEHTLCVVANTFCLCESDDETWPLIVSHLQRASADDKMDKI